jgi:hypothetical protein
MTSIPICICSLTPYWMVLRATLPDLQASETAGLHLLVRLSSLIHEVEKTSECRESFAFIW